MERSLSSDAAIATEMAAEVCCLCEGRLPSGGGRVGGVGSAREPACRDRSSEYFVFTSSCDKVCEEMFGDVIDGSERLALTLLALADDCEGERAVGASGLPSLALGRRCCD